MKIKILQNGNYLVQKENEKVELTKEQFQKYFLGGKK